MKRWIAFSSHLFAGVTSFVALSLAPVVAYGALALLHSWQSGDPGDATSVVAMPLLSALGAALFSAAVAPTLSVVAQKWTQHFRWSGLMFPTLLACAATCSLSVGNAILGWNWAPSLVITGGVALGAAFSAYWVPLRWAQKVLLGLDTKYIELGQRCAPKNKPLPTPPWHTGEQKRESSDFPTGKKTRHEHQRVRVQ